MPSGPNDLWNAFPDSEKVRQIFEEVNSHIAPGKDELATPYHFTLEVLCRLYITMIPSFGIEIDPNRRGLPLPSFAQATSARLRAIAYFSWEKIGRMFLTRRVYPTFFDFLSYSQVPAGWGALGLMLAQLNEKDDYRKRVYTCVPNIRHQRLLFPYLREANRLDYNAVLILPIFGEGQPQIANLIGACAFYVKAESDLPVDGAKERLQTFATSMAQAVVRHEEDIIKAELTSNWHAGLALGTNYMARLHLRVHPQDGSAEVLDEIANNIVRALSGNDLYCIFDPSPETEDRKSRTIWIAARDGIDARYVRKQILGFVGHACERDGNQHFSFRLEVVGPIERSGI